MIILKSILVYYFVACIFMTLIIAGKLDKIVEEKKVIRVGDLVFWVIFLPSSLLMAIILLCVQLIKKIKSFQPIIKLKKLLDKVVFDFNKKS